MNVHLSSGSAVSAYEDSLWRASIAAPTPSPLEAVMWKFVVLLLLTAFAMLVAQLVSDAPVIQTRVGAPSKVQPTYAYAGVRG
jgi:hypothetical protein